MKDRVDYTLSHCISTLIRDIADELSATRKSSSLTSCRRSVLVTGTSNMRAFLVNLNAS